MIELAAFLLFQIIVNFLVGQFLNAKKKYAFASLAYIVFGLLILAYPFIVVRLYYTFYNESDIKCGNVYIGLVAFLWVIGTPLAFLTQFLFNKFLFGQIIKDYDNNKR